MHPLHKAVGEVLRSLEGPNVRVLLDSACGGGGQQIRWFGYEPVGNKSCLAWVDAAIVVNGEIQVVLEIDESNVRPLRDSRIAAAFVSPRFEPKTMTLLSIGNVAGQRIGYLKR
jgi:hypothetical protein